MFWNSGTAEYRLSPNDLCTVAGYNSIMNNADDSKPSRNILPDDSDLGPEPDWLSDDVVEGDPAKPPSADDPTRDARESKATTHQSGPEITVEKPSASDTVEQEFAAPASIPQSPAGGTATTVEVAQVGRRSYAWLWGLAPFVLLLATGLIAWFGTTQTLNGLATWDAIRVQSPPLLPARWAMMMWWLVLPLMTLFLIFGSLPAGREVTRIKFTGPLISVGLVATTLWIFAQHWRWEIVGIGSMGIAALTILTTYVLVALGPNITNLRQRIIAVIPLSAALGYSVMLTVLAWQSYSSQPFGERGSSVLFALLLVVMAAIFAFFLRDGLFSLVLVIWFAGVVHHQWGEDAVISLIAAITVLFSAALTVLGTLLATESHRPSLTASVDNRRGRTSFFRKSADSPPE